MIKFFRGLRQKLIDEGNFKRYLIYAVGEILLLVIGILIAVQINEWNNERQNIKLEKLYLSRFFQDLNQDSLDLSTVINRSNLNIKLCTDILDSLEIHIALQHLNNPVYENALKNVKTKNGRISYGHYGGFEVETIGQQLTKLQTRRSYEVTKVTINDLTANGKMGIIRNHDLRTDIQNYYSKIMANSEYENIVVQPSLSYYHDLLIDLGIPPYSSLTANEIRVLGQRDHRLGTSVQHLLEANLHFVERSNRLNHEIRKLKGEIKKEFSTVHKKLR